MIVPSASVSRVSAGMYFPVQVLVAVLLARSFSPMVAGLVVATFVAYVSWTTLMTQVSSALQANVLSHVPGTSSFSSRPIGTGVHV